MKQSRKRCEPGCTCKRHDNSGRRYTPEQAVIAREVQLAKKREYMNQRRLADPEKARADAREQYKKNGRKYNLKFTFNITPEQLAQMIEEQNNCCYLCEDPLDGTNHIDHDQKHCPGRKSCGKCIRGVAHQLCNQGIGQFRDSPELLRKVADNLEKRIVQLAGI